MGGSHYKSALYAVLARNYRIYAAIRFFDGSDSAIINFNSDSALRIVFDQRVYL
jgi:hypothetical protein